MHFSERVTIDLLCIRAGMRQIALNEMRFISIHVALLIGTQVPMSMHSVWLFPLEKKWINQRETYLQGELTSISQPVAK